MFKSTPTTHIQAGTDIQQQGKMLTDQYPQLLLDSDPIELSIMLTTCLKQLAKSKNEDSHQIAIELLMQIFRTDTKHSSLFFLELQLKCFGSVLPEMNANAGLCLCAIKMWFALKLILPTGSTAVSAKQDPVFILLAEHPTVMTSIPMLTILTAQLHDSASQTMPFSKEASIALQHTLQLLAVIRPPSELPLRAASSTVKQTYIDGLFKELFFIYKKLFDAEALEQKRAHAEPTTPATITAQHLAQVTSEDILQIIARLPEYIYPSNAILVSWLVILAQKCLMTPSTSWFSIFDIKSSNFLPTAAMLPTYAALAALIAFAPDNQDRETKATLDHILKQLINQLAQLCSQQKLLLAQDLLTQIAVRKPLLCLPLLLKAYQYKKLPLADFLNCCIALSPVTLAKHDEALSVCICSALSENNIEALPLALALMQSTPTLWHRVIHDLDKKSGWHLLLLGTFVIVCGQGNLLTTVFDVGTAQHVTDILLERLKIENLYIRRSVAAELECLAPALMQHPAELQKVINALINLLHDQNQDDNIDVWVTRSFVPALAQHPEQLQNVLTILISRLHDDEGHVRRDAARALGYIAPSLAQQPAQFQIALSLLISRLQDAEEKVRRAAAKVLGLLASALAQQPEQLQIVLTALISCLQYKNQYRDVCSDAAEALGRFASTLAQQPEQLQKVLTALIKLLQDRDPIVISDAAKALGQFALALVQQPAELQNVLIALTSRLHNQEWYVRRESALALGRMAPALVQQPAELQTILIALISFLQDQDEYWEFRSAIARALGCFAPALAQQPQQLQNVIIALIRCLQDQNQRSHIRSAAAKALGRFALALAQQPEQLQIVFIALASLLQDQERVVRKDSVKALGHFAPALAQQPAAAKKILSMLQGLLEDEESDVQQAAYRAITQLASTLNREQKKHLLVLAVKYPKLVQFSSLANARKQCQRELHECVYTGDFIAIIKAFNKPSNTLATWLQKHEPQPLNLRAAIIAANKPLPFFNLLSDLTHCQTLRAGLPLLLRLIDLGLFHPIKQLFEIAINMQEAAMAIPTKNCASKPQPLNPHYQRILIELLVSHPEFAIQSQLPPQELLTLISPIYLSTQTPDDLIAHIEGWFTEQEFESLPEAITEHALARAVGDSQAERPRIGFSTLRLLANINLTDVITRLAKELRVVSANENSGQSSVANQRDKKNAQVQAEAMELRKENTDAKITISELARRKLLCIPLAQLMQFVASFAMPNAITADITKIINQRINKETSGQLRDMLKQVPITILLPYFTDQRKQLDAAQQHTYLEVLVAELKDKPVAIWNNKIYVDEKEYPLPAELQNALVNADAMSFREAAPATAAQPTNDLKPPSA